MSLRPGRTALVVAMIAGLLPRLQAQSDVSSTVHNLSVSGPGEFRSLTETEVCRFCHVPHNAVVSEPLWGHALSEMQQYEVPKLRRRAGLESAPQPDGSSRLCLSCHDGTVALGQIGGSHGAIGMAGAGRLLPGHRGFLGSDLSGSHPVSIFIPELGETDPHSDMTVRSRAVIESDRDVRLDARGKMQCTTCHDPHSDRYHREGEVPRFFVKSSVDEVCLTCHELR